MSRLAFVVICASGLGLVSCNSAHDQPVPTEIKTWAENEKLMEVLKQLPDEEKKAVLAYGVRAGLAEAFGKGPGVPPGMTVGDVLNAQREWEAERAKVEAEQKALAEKVAVEQAAATKVMNDALTVAVTKLQYKKQRWDTFIAVSVAFENKTDKVLSGAKGRIVFNDMFGDKIKAVTLSYDEGVAPKAKAVWNGRIDYNQFMDADKKLATTPLERMKVEWIPDTYLYKDGSKMQMPQGG